MGAELSHALNSIYFHSERESAVWLNALLARLYASCFNSGYLDDKAVEKLSIEIDDFTNSILGRALGFRVPTTELIFSKLFILLDQY